MRPGNAIRQIPEICILEDVPLGIDLTCTWTKTCQKNYLSIYNLIIEGKLSSLIKRLGAGHKKSDGDLTKAEGVFLCVVGELLRRIFGPTSPASDFFEMPIYQRTHIIQSYRIIHVPPQYSKLFDELMDSLVARSLTAFSSFVCRTPTVETRLLMEIKKNRHVALQNISHGTSAVVYFSIILNQKSTTDFGYNHSTDSSGNSHSDNSFMSLEPFENYCFNALKTLPRLLRGYPATMFYFSAASYIDSSQVDYPQGLHNFASMINDLTTRLVSEFLILTPIDRLEWTGVDSSLLMAAFHLYAIPILYKNWLMDRCINADITLLTKSKPPHDAVLMFNEAVARKNFLLNDLSFYWPTEEELHNWCSPLSAPRLRSELLRKMMTWDTFSGLLVEASPDLLTSGILVSNLSCLPNTVHTSSSIMKVLKDNCETQIRCFIITQFCEEDGFIAFGSQQWCLIMTCMANTNAQFPISLQNSIDTLRSGWNIFGRNAPLYQIAVPHSMSRFQSLTAMYALEVFLESDCRVSALMTATSAGMTLHPFISWACMLAYIGEIGVAVSEVLLKTSPSFRGRPQISCSCIRFILAKFSQVNPNMWLSA